MSRAPFNLRDAVLDEMRRNKSADPNVIATAVLRKIKGDQAKVLVALATTMPAYVRTLRNEHVGPARLLTGGGQAARASHHVPPAPAGRPHAEASANYRRAARNRVRGWLTETAPGADGQWKYVGDFNFADCVAAAEERRMQSKAIAARADWFEQLAAAVKANKADTVKDLPEAVLDGLR